RALAHPGGQLFLLGLRHLRRADSLHARPAQLHQRPRRIGGDARVSLRIAGRWYEWRRVGDGITLLWEPHVTPLMRCNIWHVRGRERDLLVDTGMGFVSLRQAAREVFEKKVTAVATHTHSDHIGSHHEFEERLVHRLEADQLAAPYTMPVDTSGM